MLLSKQLTPHVQDGLCAWHHPLVFAGFEDIYPLQSVVRSIQLLTCTAASFTLRYKCLGCIGRTCAGDLCILAEATCACQNSLVRVQHLRYLIFMFVHSEWERNVARGIYCSTGFNSDMICDGSDRTCSGNRMCTGWMGTALRAPAGQGFTSPWIDYSSCLRRQFSHILMAARAYATQVRAQQISAESLQTLGSHATVSQRNQSLRLACSLNSARSYDGGG